MASDRRKWYVVWQGTEPGICDSWAECESRVKGFPGARYKAFDTQEEAVEDEGVEGVETHPFDGNRAGEPPVQPVEDAGGQFRLDGGLLEKQEGADEDHPDSGQDLDQDTPPFPYVRRLQHNLQI